MELEPPGWRGERPPLFRRVCQTLLIRFLRAFWGFRVSGFERVPRQGPVIVAGNHISNLDPVILSIALDGARTPRSLAKIEIFSVPVLGFIIRRYAGGLPLDRKRGDVGAMRAAEDVLRAGWSLMLFPEGTRSKTGEPLRPKPGVGFLAGRTGAPVVPARLVNTHCFPPGRPLEVRFGEPMRFEGDPKDRAACQAFAEAVMKAVFSL